MAEENKAEQKTPAAGDAHDKLESSKQHARRAAEDLKSAAGAIAEEYRGKAEQKWGEARGKAEQAWGDARDRARTFQEDADFLGIWYSGWYNGLAKKHAINVPRVKENIHNVIVYCKANKDVTVIKAIDSILKAEKN